HAVEERGIPLLREYPVLPKETVSMATGKCDSKYREALNVVQVYFDEKKKWVPADQRLQKTKDWVSLAIAPTGKNKYIAYCLDFGKETTGSIRLSITGAKGTEIVDTLITEGIANRTPCIREPDKVWGGNSFGNRLTLRAGKTEHEQFDYWGFRYLILIVRNSTSKLNIKLRVHGVGYPLDIKAAFETSNPTLNQIYAISAWTQQCCMFDAYVDCPWREQAQWWGDARVQAGNTFYLSADARLVKRGIKQIGTQETPDGLTYGHAPTIAHSCILPDFTLVWIITHWDYYWQTNDVSLFIEMKDRIHRALHYFYEMTADNGLLPYDNRYWLFLDWTGIFKEGYPTLYNLLYLMALRKAVELFKLIGDRKSVKLYSGRAKTLQQAISKRLFNQKTQSFYGGLTWQQKPFFQDIPHNIAFAVLLDLYPQHQAAFTKRLERLVHNYQLFENAKGEGDIKQAVIPSPYFIYYIFEALKKQGENAAVIDCIERLWGNMVKKGLSTTEELWNAEPGYHSLCHAWSAHPIIHLSNILLGIKQTKPGWQEISFSPVFVHADKVNGKVATPFGTIASGWEKRNGNTKVYLKLPKGIKANIILPGVKPIKIEKSYTTVLSSKDSM
ncbi:MAG: alpha-L-rhamnosidase C-terminal domain-containing protein, partial [bacterium]